MPEMDLYETIARAVTVESLQEPFELMIPDTVTVECCYEALWEDQVALVVRGDEPIGWVRGFEFDQILERDLPEIKRERNARLFEDLSGEWSLEDLLSETEGLDLATPNDTRTSEANSSAGKALTWGHDADETGKQRDRVVPLLKPRMRASGNGLDETSAPGVPVPLITDPRFMRPITKLNTILASATFAEAVEKFSNFGKDTSGQQLFLVSDGARLIGSLDYRDLFKPAGRICFFALTMELERAALDFCQFWALIRSKRHFFNDQYHRLKLMLGRDPRTREDDGPNIDEEPLFLDPNAKVDDDAQKSRTAIAFRQFRSNHRDLLSARERTGDELWLSEKRTFFLLACIQFCDKKIILMELAKRGVFRGWSKTKLERTFKVAERLRNHCAHPSGVEGQKFSFGLEPEIEFTSFPKFVTECQTLICDLKEQTPPWTLPWWQD